MGSSKLFVLVTVMILGLIGSTIAGEIIIAEDGCEPGTLLLRSDSSGTCVKTITEPNCNVAFETELQWCRANAACKGRVISVEGKDLSRGVCAYEECVITCENVPLVRNIQTFGNVAELQTLVATLQKNINDLSALNDALSKRLDELEKKPD